jgi:hypothetical protein
VRHPGYGTLRWVPLRVAMFVRRLAIVAVRGSRRPDPGAGPVAGAPSVRIPAPRPAERVETPVAHSGVNAVPGLGGADPFADGHDGRIPD